MDEVWKPVENYPYEVSNLGKVRRIKGKKGTTDGRVLSPYPNPKGYLRVSLYSEDGIRRVMTVHKLVMVAFLGECPEGMEINHKDGSKVHNHVDNLEYVSHQENMQHAAEHDLFGDRKGEKHGRAKLTDSNVLEIRRLREEGYLLKELSRQFGVSIHHVHRIVKRKAWTHI